MVEMGYHWLMRILNHLKTWLLVLIMVAMSSGVASGKSASGGIDFAGGVSQGLDVSKSLNALGIAEVSTVRALDSPLVPNTGAQRARVEANIAESRAARESSQFETHLAKTDQLNGNYKTDQWQLGPLKQGDQVYGGIPGQSSYYTSRKTLDNSNLDREQLFQSLQVTPHPEFGYRPKVGVYELQRDLPRVPYGKVRANPDKGVGEGDQFWIRNYEKDLKLVDEIDLN